MCGEQHPLHDRHPLHTGSPPRVRGTVTPFINNMRDARITPACAGNRSVTPSPRWCKRDHPRVCGEQANRRCSALSPGGSPPRVRGTAKLSTCSKSGKRITPACAGNSVLPVDVKNKLRDHPRVCGEQDMIGALDSQLEGSPPRVRGTGHGWCPCCGSGRITPACAGNSIRLSF